GQVIKTRRNDRVVKIERKVMIGAGRLRQALLDSEDSVKLNTSLVERLNLTIRQGSAYLAGRTLGQTRGRKHLDDHLELLRCHYNFVRPHRTLNFGREGRTSAMQAGLTNRSLTLREIFSWRTFWRLAKNVIFVLFASARPAILPARGLALVF